LSYAHVRLNFWDSDVSPSLARRGFYIMNLAEGGRMRSGVLDHEYSFSLEEVEAWLDTHVK